MIELLLVMAALSGRAALPQACTGAATARYDAVTSSYATVSASRGFG
jgi:hypothetical protein